MTKSQGRGGRPEDTGVPPELTEDLRQRISYLKLVYSLTEPLDFTASEEMPHEESWYVGVKRTRHRSAVWRSTGFLFTTSATTGCMASFR